MVKLSLDTNRDEVEDLEEAIEILQEAVTRREAESKLDIPDTSAQDIVNTSEEGSSIDTGFLEIKVETEAIDVPEVSELPKEPITESELTDMFDKHEEGKEKKREESEEDDSDSFIEIVEFEED